MKPVEGKLYTVRYPAGGRSGEGDRVATTRPETMLGDTGGRGASRRRALSRHLVGEEVQVPLTGRSVPVIADDVRGSARSAPGR